MMMSQRAVLIMSLVKKSGLSANTINRDQDHLQLSAHQSSCLQECEDEDGRRFALLLRHYLL